MMQNRKLISPLGAVDSHGFWRFLDRILFSFPIWFQSCWVFFFMGSLSI